MAFAMKLVELQPLLTAEKYRFCRAFSAGPGELEAVLASLDFERIWEEAKMAEVVQYLRGAKELKVPPEYKRWLPKTI